MKLTALFFVLVFGLLIQLSCSKTGGTPPPPPPDPCLMLNIGLSGAVTNPSVSGAKDGSITVSATGSSGFTFCVNGGAWQASGTFMNLAAGNYTIIAKTPDGCTGSISFELLDPAISCVGVNIAVTTSATGNIPCEASTADVTVTASGGTGPYTYSLNGGAFQAANKFYNLPSGSYSITVKDANGCMGSASTTVNNLVAGPLFTQARLLIRAHCLYCHGAILSAGGINYSEDCTIVLNKDRIKARAVDGVPSPMPQTGLIPAADRQKIMDWINAGGKFTN